MAQSFQIILQAHEFFLIHFTNYQFNLPLTSGYSLMFPSMPLALKWPVRLFFSAAFCAVHCHSSVFLQKSLAFGRFIGWLWTCGPVDLAEHPNLSRRSFSSEPSCPQFYYVGDRICRCASAKEWTLPTCQKNRECNTPQERFPRLWNYLGWPAAVTACHSPVSWMALSTPTCGGQGFLYADHRCGRSFTAFKMVVIASLRSLGISSPNQNTEIPRDQLDDVKKTHV